MSRQLKLSLGQHSDKGRKETNQDFHGALIPSEPALSAKGIAIALADGISSSSVSHIASQSAIKGFLTDYYCTSDAWSVKTSAQRVIAATNSWLHSQTRRQHAYDADKGYVCTLSVMVVKSTTAYLFHIGDSRIFRVAGQSLEQLTNDHRVVVSSQQSYLGRALGANPDVEIDYRTVPLEVGDTFLMATDGVYEHVSDGFMLRALATHSDDLDRAAQTIVAEALTNGSADNLTAQIVRVDELPTGNASEAIGHAADLPLPPLLEARALFDGYKILRQIHASSRSHIYLASDLETGEMVALKIPSIDLRSDPAYLKRLMMEEWVARRITSAHVLKAPQQTRKRNYLYVVTEFVEGKTLAQWMIDNPKPAIEVVRGIVEQIEKGLRAFHRLEMLHQDLRPQNIMIDPTGTVKIIDFGSTLVPGVVEASPQSDGADILGTAQYTAPEYFLGDGGTERSDQFSLGVIAYQMLTGRLPYGTKVAAARTSAQQRKLTYTAARNTNPELPVWIDGALKKAVHTNPLKRYEALSEFVYDLRYPSDAFLTNASAPLLERNPLLFWKLLSLALACAVFALLAMRVR